MVLSKKQYAELKQQIEEMIQENWTGKKGFWTDSTMFKYTSFYTGNKKSIKKIV